MANKGNKAGGISVPVTRSSLDGIMNRVIHDREGLHHSVVPFAAPAAAAAAVVPESELMDPASVIGLSDLLQTPTDTQERSRCGITVAFNTDTILNFMHRYIPIIVPCYISCIIIISTIYSELSLFVISLS